MTKLIEALINYLDCSCQYFESMKDDCVLMQTYHKARERGKKEGFVPIIIIADESLWETLIINSDEESDGDEDYNFNKEQVTRYRKKIMEDFLELNKEEQERLYLKKYQERVKNVELKWNTEILGGKGRQSFEGHWNEGMKVTYPLILAEIPVQYPWEIFAYLPFGNWNDCPDTYELMTVTKYWFERYHAMLALITCDSLEFYVPFSVNKEKAITLAAEQYEFCHYVMDLYQGEVFDMGKLVDSLMKSKVWYFWWD